MIEKIKNDLKMQSYSQCAEDIIIDYIFSNLLKIDKPTYLDLGAYHPYELSNTYRFYKKGSRGVCIEADPTAIDLFKKIRGEDVVVNIGVGVSNENEADFYVFENTRSLNTFSKEAAEKAGIKIDQIIKIPLRNINWIIEKYCRAAPDFISIDIEGMDFDIIKQLDFVKYRPKVICIETLEFSTKIKLVEIINFLKYKEYCVYSDTFLSTIFLDKHQIGIITEIMIYLNRHLENIVEQCGRVLKHKFPIIYKVLKPYFPDKK